MRVLPGLVRRLALTSRSLGQIRPMPFSSATTPPTGDASKPQKSPKSFVSEVPIGMQAGAMDNPEFHTYDRSYKGSEHIPDWVYREPWPDSGWMDKTMTHILSALFIYWVVYHFYYHTGHLIGEFYMPQLEEFSDAELGIPPDDAPDPEYWGPLDDQKK
uniref:NADH dehydrogenase [ubiquinone] 1 beta subcomplex subunit 2, mitochondrial n=1 Tax=Plectus sambesii TaxID=2011161 RepID=A0A914XH32_9BILA